MHPPPVGLRQRSDPGNGADARERRRREHEDDDQCPCRNQPLHRRYLKSLVAGFDRESGELGRRGAGIENHVSVTALLIQSKGVEYPDGRFAICIL